MKTLFATALLAACSIATSNDKKVDYYKKMVTLQDGSNNDVATFSMGRKVVENPGALDYSDTLYLTLEKATDFAIGDDLVGHTCYVVENNNVQCMYV